MGATKNGIVGREVYDKKSGMMGRVIKEDGLSITIEFNDGEKKDVKTVTPTIFNRWYRVLDEDNASGAEQSAQQEQPDAGKDNGDDQGDGKEQAGGHEQGEPQGDKAEEPKKERKPRAKKESTPPKYPVGEKGVGEKLATEFKKILETLANQDLDYKTTKDPRALVVRYNGHNVFEMTICQRRLHIMCHKKSLSPDNLKRATKEVPDSFGWPLSVQYTFIESTEESRALMKCIATDGLYYRQKVETAKDEDGESGKEE